MSAFVNNPFALLSDDVEIQAAAAPKKPAKVPAPSETKPPKPSTDRVPKDRDARPAAASAPRGRGGRVSAPRPPREPNNADFTGGEGAPSSRPPRAPRGDRPPHGGSRHVRGDNRSNRRDFDRRSGTGRHDGEKKEVAGASWGDAIESVGVTEGQSAETALEIAENPIEESSTTPTTTGATGVDGKVAEEDNTKSYADYKKELNAKKGSLKAKPARKANEGVEDASLQNVEILSKKDLSEEAGSLAMLLSGSKQKKKTDRKQPKDRQVVTDLLQFQFAADAPRRSDRSDRFGDRSARNGGRSAPSHGGRNKSSPVINVNDKIAFPTLA